MQDDAEIFGFEESSLSPISDLERAALSAYEAYTLRNNLEDDVVSQNLRTETENAMVDVPVLEQNDFLNDITQRPADLDSTVMSDVRPGSSSSRFLYQEINFMEVMHGDEEQEYAPDALSTPDPIAFEMNSTRIQDVMNASFYNDATSDSNKQNSVEADNEADRENDAPASEMGMIGHPSVEAARDFISVGAENPTSTFDVEEPFTLNAIPDQCLNPEPQANVVAESDSITAENASGNDEVVAETAALTETIAETVAVAGAAVATVTKATSTNPADPKTEIAPAAKKRLSAGVKAKPKAKSDATTATKTAPVPRPRTVASQLSQKTIEKKPTSTSGAKKPTSALAGKKLVNGVVKPTATASSVTKRPISITTTKPTVSARRGSTSKPSPNDEATKRFVDEFFPLVCFYFRFSYSFDTFRVATTKTTTNTTPSTLKPRRPSISSISKANTSATDKTAKDTVNKLQASGARGTAKNKKESNV